MVQGPEYRFWSSPNCYRPWLVHGQTPEQVKAAAAVQEQQQQQQQQQQQWQGWEMYAQWAQAAGQQLQTQWPYQQFYAGQDPANANPAFGMAQLGAALPRIPSGGRTGRRKR